MFKKNIKFDPKRSRLRTFLEPLRLLRLPYLGTTFIALLQATYGIVLIWFTAKVVGLFETGDYSNFQFYVTSFGIYMVVFYAIKMIARHLNSDVDHNVASLLKQYLYGRFVSMDNNQAETKGTGRITSILGKGVAAWNNVLWFVARRAVREGMNIAFALVFIATFSVKFLLIAVVMIFFLGGAIHFMNKRIQKLRQSKKEISIEEDRHKIKILMSKFEVLQNEKLSDELIQVEGFQENKRTIQRSINNYSYPMYHLPGAGASFMRLAVMVLVGAAIFAGTSSIEEFVALMGAMGYIHGIVSRLTDSHRFFQEEFVHLEKLFDFLDEMKLIKGLHTGNPFIYKHGNISIQNLNFGYGDKLVFEGLSLDIQGGKKTAFVGASGSGKSTLIKLMAGYLHPDSGDIRIDGQSLSKTKLQSYYKHIGYLTQEPSVFDGTIIENLTYAVKGNITKKTIKEAITLAKCEFIYDFEKKLETVIGERGIKLSGGQRQRLAIAKIFIKNPEIILLDEPTSALDSFSEEAITQAMHNLFEGRTVVVIAHRLQTVKESDDIILFEQGKIAERGTHNELVKKNGYYAKMLELQSGF